MSCCIHNHKSMMHGVALFGGWPARVFIFSVLAFLLVPLCMMHKKATENVL